MRTWPTAWGRIGAVRGWMWIPIDLADFGAGIIVGIAGIGMDCAIALALGTTSVPIDSRFDSKN